MFAEKPQIAGFGDQNDQGGEVTGPLPYSQFFLKKTSMADFRRES
jgi:hypothetical protein